jgi:hypothetical protein
MPLTSISPGASGLPSFSLSASRAYASLRPALPSSCSFYSDPSGAVSLLFSSTCFPLAIPRRSVLSLRSSRIADLRLFWRTTAILLCVLVPCGAICSIISSPIFRRGVNTTILQCPYWHFYPWRLHAIGLTFIVLSPSGLVCFGPSSSCLTRCLDCLNVGPQF